MGNILLYKLKMKEIETISLYSNKHGTFSLYFDKHVELSVYTTIKRANIKSLYCILNKIKITAIEKLLTLT
jgi:hypothetical protein